MFARSLFKSLLAASFLWVWFTGCAHRALNPEYTGPRPLPEEIRRAYSHEKFMGEYIETVLLKKKNVTIKQIEFLPSHNILTNTHNIRIDYYDVNHTEKKPVVMVLPILGGSNKFAKNFASYFAKKGYAAVIVHRQKQYKRLKEIDTIDLTLRQIVFDHKQVIDWIETRKELDSKRIGVFGISMGGIKSALISSLDYRIRASVIAMAAGNIPYLLAYSSEKGVIKKRKKFMKKQGLTVEAFHSRLKDEITCDPIHFAEFINARNVLLILARFDRVIPYAKGKELREKMGSPETLYLFSGHYTALPYIFYVKWKAYRFFRRSLE